MRHIHGSENIEYAQFLALMSYLPTLRGVMKLPKGIESFSWMQEFCQTIFPISILEASYSDCTLLRNCTTLSSQNDNVTEFNSQLIAQFPGQVHHFDAVNSADIYDAESETEELPMESLQSINHPSLPSS